MKWTERELTLLKAAYAVDKPASEINLSALAAALGRDKANVCRKARALGLTNQRRPKTPQRKGGRPRRFKTEAEVLQFRSARMSEWLQKNGHPRGAKGLKHTEAARAVMAAKSRAHWAALTDQQKAAHTLKQLQAKRAKGISIVNPHGSWKAGWRDVGQQPAFFRSRWEANYARYLEWLREIGEIESWEHEPHTFWFEGLRGGVVSYLPDFRVVEKDGTRRWHEVKGWMDARSKTALNRMAKYYPHEVIVLIREKQYREIERKVSRLITGWEAS